MEELKLRQIILYFVLPILIIPISCMGRINRFEEGLIKSNELYIDLSSQLNYALKNNSQDTEKVEKLNLINQKLEEYREDYDSFQKILTAWRNSGEKPEITMQSYKKMWYSLLDAQTLAAQSYIYTSECSARTAIKGKAGTNCP